MSSLFRRKAKAFEHDDDEFSSSVSSIFAKKTIPKRRIKEIKDDDDDDDDDDDITMKSKKGKLEEVGIQEDDDDYRAQIRAKLQTVKPKNRSVPISQTLISTRSSRKSIDGDLTSPTKDSEFKEAASLLLNKMTLSKKSLSQSSSKSSSSKKTTENEIIDLDSPSNFIVPKVPQAVIRVPVSSTSNESSALMSIDRMQALIGKTASISSSFQSEKSCTTNILNKPHRKIKIRLNGTHERKWKVGLDEPFGRMKANFAVAYGVKASDVRFEYDGSVVLDSDTPDALEIEDEDLMEAIMNKALYEKAVRYSEAQLKTQTTSTTSAAVPSSSSSMHSNNNNVNNKPSIKLCTRLNGKHEWKWKVPIDEGFDKIRSNLAALYGLKDANAITLVFDGNKLQDSDTPQALELENDDMIDANINAGLYDNAISCVTAKKTSI